MYLPALALLGGALATGVWFGFADLAASAAQRFTDTTAYAHAVFVGPTRIGVASSSAPEWYDYLYGFGAVVVAFAIAALDLRGGRASAAWARMQALAAATMRPIRRLHSGKIGDYTAALTVGVGVLGALLALTVA